MPQIKTLIRAVGYTITTQINQINQRQQAQDRRMEQLLLRQIVVR